MNLREMVGTAFTLVGDPARRKIPYGEVIRHLNIGQQVLGSFLWNYDRMKFLGIYNQQSTSGTSDYSTAADLRELVRVVYNNVESQPFPARDLNALEGSNPIYRPLKGVQQYYVEMEGSLPGKTTVKLIPTPDITGKSTTVSSATATTVVLAAGSSVDNYYNGTYIKITSGSDINDVRRVVGYVGSTRTCTVDAAWTVTPAAPDTLEVGYNLVAQWYFRRPVDFHEQGSYEGIATGGSTTTLVDTGAPFNTSGTTTSGFWSSASIRFTSGSNAGIYRRVATWTPASSTFTLDSAVPTAVAATHTYELDQVSILPEYVHHLMPYYAAALAAPKAGLDPAMFWNVWNSEIEGMRRRYLDNTEVNIPGQTNEGIAPNRVQV